MYTSQTRGQHIGTLLREFRFRGFEIQFEKNHAESLINDSAKLLAIPEDYHTDIGYCVALHEIGHDRTRRPEWLGQTQRYKWQSEVAAWRWARRNAIEWTRQMEFHALYCLGTYRKVVKQRSPRSRNNKRDW